MAKHVNQDRRTRRANLWVVLIVGAIALAFYLLQFYLRS